MNVLKLLTLCVFSMALSNVLNAETAVNGTWLLCINLDGEPLQQIELCEEALKDQNINETDRAFALFVRGKAYQGLGKSEEAIADFGESLKLNPDVLAVLIRRGEVFRDLGKPDLAMADFNRAIEVDPDYAPALTGKAALLMELAQFTEALAAIEKAIQLSPPDAYKYSARGRIQFASQKMEGRK